jgi:hypothetical protein
MAWALASAGILATTAAFASVVWGSAVTVAKVDVEADQTGTGNGAILVTFGSAPMTTSCSSNTNGLGYWMVGGNQDTIKAVHTTALSAKLAGSLVKIAFNNAYTAGSTVSCSGGGSSGFPILRGIEVQ